MPKSVNNSLPATTAENIILLIDTLKKKNSNESEVKALFGKGDSVYTNTKSALKTFGFIDTDGLTFTPDGREIAYSQGEDKKTEMIKILKKYSPYEVFLLSLLNKGDVTTTEIEDITNFWGKAKFGEKQRNREDAAKLFMSIIDYCDFGNYIIGRGSNATRIEWSTDIKNKIENLRDENLNQDILKTYDNNTSATDENCEEATTATMVTEENPTQKVVADNIENVIRKSEQVSPVPNIVINVDMGDWPDEKIKNFFKYAYGKFEEK